MNNIFDVFIDISIFSKEKLEVITIKKFHSLQHRIMIFSIIIVITPLLFVGTISYIKSSSILQKKISISNLNTVKQTGNNIEFILKNVHDFSLYLFQNDTVKEFLKLPPETQYKTIQQKRSLVIRELLYLLNSKNYIQSVYLSGFNGLTIETKGSQEQLNEDILNNTKKLRGAPYWLFHTITRYDNSKINVLSIVRVINDIDNITKALGILKINISEDAIAKIYANDDQFSKQGHYYIINKDNMIISSLNKDELMSPISPAIIKPEIGNKKYGYYQVKLNNDDYLITYYDLDYIGYKLINLVPLKELLIENIVIKKVTIYSMFLSTLICLIFILLFYYKVLHPLNQVRNVMQELENGNFDIRLNIKGYNEIAVLGKTFNKMSARLQELMEQVYLEKVKQKEAELKALQAQVNPHFLYNTLDTIYWMSRMENAQETSDLVKALARLFRLSLNKGNEFTTVKKELEHLESYLTIQKKRYSGLITFTIDLDEKVLNCKVVKLVLQPLVENAIYHGIEKNGGKGTVNVIIKKQGRYLIYEITDDGQGANVSELNRLLTEVGEENRGFGIKNVNDRIKLYFGDDCGLTFFSTPGKGTTVIVKQTYINEGDKYVQHDDS